MALCLSRNDAAFADRARTESARDGHKHREPENSSSSVYNYIAAQPHNADIARLYDLFSSELHATARGMISNYDHSFGRTLRNWLGDHLSDASNQAGLIVQESPLEGRYVWVRTDHLSRLH